MKNYLFVCFLSLFCFVSANDFNSELIDVRDLAFEVSSDDQGFASAICSEIVGNVEITHHVNCFLCSQARANRKCQQQLTEILEGVTEYGACSC